MLAGLLLSSLALLSLLSPACAQSISQNQSAPIVYASTAYFDPLLYLSPLDDLLATQHVTGATISGREGAAYVDDGNSELHIAGGVNFAPGTMAAYRDIYVFDTVADYIYGCTQQLPSTLYYATSDFIEATEQWYIYSGVMSAPGAAVSYFANMYQVDFLASVGGGNPCPATAVKTVTLSPQPAPRQWAASLIIPNSGLYYVFGGLNTQSPLTAAQTFFTINLQSAAVTPLSMQPAQFVHPGLIDPLMMVDREADEVFFYSGWTQMNQFEGTHLMYRYDNEFNLWLQPISPLLNQRSAVVAPLPDIVFAGKTHTVDALHYIAAAGADSAGWSGDLIVHIDLTTENYMGAPTISVLFTETPVDLQGSILGVNQELDIFLIGGATYFPGATVVYPNLVLEAKLPILSSSNVVDYYAQTTTNVALDDTHEFGAGASIIPAQREGAAYGSWEGNDVIVFAGGAFIAAESILAYTDIWYMSLKTDQFIKARSTLPMPHYFGVSEFVVELNSLFFWGGRTNLVAPNVGNTYNAQLWRIDYSSGDPTNPTVTATTLTGISGLQGTQHSSIIEAHEKLFMFGGMTGPLGMDTPPVGQQWFVVDLLNGYATKALSRGGAFPSNVWINPTLFTEATENYLYLYSGMLADGMSWNSPFTVSVYSINGDTWLPGVEPRLSPYTSLPNQLPNIVFAGHAMSLDDQHLLLLGGSEGPHTPNVPGTHNKVVHIDATPLNGNQTTASPIICVLPARLLYAVQSPVAAMEVSDTEIVIFGGAQYPDAYNPFAQQYVPYVQELTLLSYQNVVGGQASGSSSSSSSSSLSGGAIAGITIGVVIGALLCCVLGYLLGNRQIGSGHGASDMEMGNGKARRLGDD